VLFPTRSERSPALLKVPRLSFSCLRGIVALTLYSDTYWFPSGILAANVPARVFPEGSSAPAQLWADAAGTIPLTNPLPTDGLGVLSFFAAVGRYWVHIDTEVFLIDVGMSQEQADLSTGIASGGEINENLTDPTAVDIGELIGYVVDNTQTGPGLPSVVRVDAPAQTVVLDAASQARSVTWLLMDSSGNVIQQGPRPSNIQRRTHLVLGGVLFDVGAGVLLETQTIPVILPQQANQLVDLMDGLGPFSISGNRISANGVNRSFNKSSGELFSRAFNHFSGPVLTEDPHVSTSPAQAPAQFRRLVQIVSPTPPVVTTLDPANYDVGGVVTPVGGGANTSTIQRVYVFATNLPSNQLIVQYGQQTYGSLSAAIAAIGAGTFLPNPTTVNGALIGYIAVTRTATNLTDPTQAAFVNAGKFATP